MELQRLIRRVLPGTIVTVGLGIAMSIWPIVLLWFFFWRLILLIKE